MSKVRRCGDMDPDVSLSVHIQEDGDVILSIGTGRGLPLKEGKFSASVEFCTLIGGGHSPRVKKALTDLYKAIEEDNKSFPEFNPDHHF